MKQSHLIDIVRALNTAAIRYVIVGGVAVNAHGYLRHTKDVDIALSLEPENCRAAMRALSALSYRPRIPEPIEHFANPSARESWIAEKHMIVFQLWSDERPETPVDVFVSEPFDVGAEFLQARMEELSPGVRAPIASFATLRKLKLAAGRPQDLADVAKLDDVQTMKLPNNAP